MVEKGNGSSILKPTYKESCMTCKIRKKKCSRQHPICADCKRLNKRCEWIDDNMTIQEIRDLKEKVLQNEKEYRVKRKVEMQTKKISTIEANKRIINFNSNMGTMLNGSCFNVLDFGVKTEAGSDQSDNTEKKKPKWVALTQENKNAKAGTVMKSDTNPCASPNILSLCYRSSPILNESGHNASLTDFLIETQSFLKETSASNKIINLQNDERMEQEKRIIDPNADMRKRISVETAGLSKIEEMFNVIRFDKVASSPESIKTQQYVPIDEENLEDHVTTIENNEYLLDSLEYELQQAQSPKFILPLMNSYTPLVLNGQQKKYYDYYTSHLSKIVSIIPPELNYYTVLFLPLAAKNSGVMNAILSWSAAHMGYEKESAFYSEKSLESIEFSPVENVQDSVERLSNWVILIATKLCLGDISKWNEYMTKAVKVIEDAGGIKHFNKTKEQNWLISNVFYHDILSSSSNENGTLYPTEVYDEFIADEQFGVLDPLTGLVKPLLTIIGEISNLASASRILFKEVELDDSIDKQNSLISIVAKVTALETKIDNARPNFKLTRHFSIKELELQFTLFELFQFIGKLLLRHSVLNLGPSSLETQILVNEALKSFDIVFGSSVETILCFPLLIIGINCSKEKDRQLVLKRFDEFIDRCHFKQIFRAKTLVLKVWELDPDGNKCIDWYSIIKEFEWDVCFA